MMAHMSSSQSLARGVSGKKTKSAPVHDRVQSHQSFRCRGKGSSLRLFGYEFGACADTRHQSQPTAVTSHHLDNECSGVTVRGRVDVIDSLAASSQRTVASRLSTTSISSTNPEMFRCMWGSICSLCCSPFVSRLAAGEIG
jgi:hypothetical protein